jgi:ABC-type Fe3+ transport system permease subunit
MSFLASPTGRRTCLLLTLVLLGHLIPTIVIGFGFVIPGSCIAGINQFTLGFISSIVGYIPTFIFGVYLARKLARTELLAELGRSSS